MRVERIPNVQASSAISTKEIDLALLNPILEKYSGKKGSLIPILQQTQDVYGFIPDIAFTRISEKTGLKQSVMYGVATFYSQFRLKPAGKHVIKVCHGTACHVQNADFITSALQELLKVEDGETTPDGLFTLELVACLGCCSLAPVMMIDGETYGKLNGKSAAKVIREIKKNG